MAHTFTFEVTIEIPEDQAYDSLVQFSSLATKELDKATDEIIKKSEIRFLSIPPVEVNLS